MKRHLFALLFILAGSAVFAQPSVTLPGPITSIDQWWPFCSATDHMDRTFNGFDLLSSMVGGTRDRYLIQNKADTFNGVNSELHYSTTLTVPMFGIADLTYGCWIYPTAAQYAVIIYNGNPALDGFGVIQCDGAGVGPGINLAMRFGGLNTHVCGTVTLNQWHHVVMRRNGNSYILTVDNVPSGTPYIPVGFPASGYNTPTTFFQLGMDLTSGTMAYSGKIDDIVTYSRQLTPAEILQLSNHNPNISFTLGSDTAIAPNSMLLGGTIDTTSFVNENMNPTLGYAYTWSTADTFTTIQVTFGTALTETRALTIERLHSCPASDAITIRHIVPVVNIGPPNLNACTGDSVVLNATGDSVGLMTFTWNTGATTRTYRPTTSGQYSLIIDSVFTTESPITHSPIPDTVHAFGYDTVNMHFNAEIFVHISDGDGGDTTCDGSPILLQSYDDTAYGSPTYLWQDGFTTTPTFLAATTGKYWVQVTDSACVRSDTVNIVIANVGVNVLSPDTAICMGASFVARSTGTPGVLYQWTPTAGIPVSIVPNPTITADTSTWYKVTTTIIEPLSGALLHCMAVDSFFVDVQPNPIVKLGGNRNICEFDTIRITPTVTPGWYTHYIYDWSPGTFLDDSTAPEVIYTAGDTTKLILIVTTPAGCDGADSIIINKYNGNFLSMATDTAICPGDTIAIGPLSTEPGITNYSWTPSTYINDPETPTPVTIRPIGNINYRVVGTSMYGCTDTLNYFVRVFPAAVITLEDSVALFPGDTYQIEPVTNATSFSWFPPEGLSDTAVSNPLASPSIETKYVLTARTADGCLAKDSINIRLHEHSVITVPNAFAPGHINSQLNVILKGIARLRYFRIYNRWGKVVFEARNINQGWDGNVDGAPQPMGVYIYEAEAITEKGKIIHKQGNVTLLR